MDAAELRGLVALLRARGAELSDVEAKAAAGGLPKSVRDTPARKAWSRPSAQRSMSSTLTMARSWSARSPNLIHGSNPAT